MNVLYTITSYPPSIGGAQYYSHMLAVRTARQHKINALTFWKTNRNDWLLGTTINAPNRSHHYEIDGVPVHTIGLSLRERFTLLLPTLLYYPAISYMVPLLSRRLKSHLEDYVQAADIVHNFRVGREPLSFASYQLASTRDIPFVFTPFHHPRWVGWRYNAYLRLSNMANVVNVLTYSEKDTLVRLGIAPDQIIVTGMGPILAESSSPERFRNKYGIDGPLVLFVGQHYPYKGYQQLLKATRLVWERIPEAKFAFIGPAIGNSEDFFREFRDERILRLGVASLQEKTDALAACSVLCLPSTQESFGGVFTEAWTFKKPVLGCDIPAVREIIGSDQECGMFVQQEKSSIAEKIIELLLDANLAQQLGENGYWRLQQRYTWDKLFQQIQEIYTALHAGRMPQQL